MVVGDDFIMKQPVPDYEPITRYFDAKKKENKGTYDVDYEEFLKLYSALDKLRQGILEKFIYFNKEVHFHPDLVRYVKEEDQYFFLFDILPFEKEVSANLHLEHHLVDHRKEIILYDCLMKNLTAKGTCNV